MTLRAIRVNVSNAGPSGFGRNDTVPVSQTQSTIPQDLLQDVMRRPYRERLRLIINELGTGLAGRPQDLNAVIHRADPALQQTSRVLKILGNQNKVIQNFIVNSDTVMRQLAARKHDVARFIVEADKTSSITASREQAFQAQWHKLPAFLAGLQPTMAKLGNLADQQTPLLSDLHRAAPDLNTFFKRLGPFSEASRPAFKSLGQTSLVGRKALNDSRREVDQRDSSRFGTSFSRSLKNPVLRNWSQFSSSFQRRCIASASWFNASKSGRFFTETASAG